VEDVEVEEPIPEEKDADKKDPDAMETDAANGEEKPKTRKVKKQVRKGDLQIAAGTASLDSETKEKSAEKEGSMIMEDKLVADTEDKKNELETFIYDMRNKIDEQYADFASDEEKTKLKAKLEASEDWLYEEGEDTTKAVYIAKMDEIRAVAGTIVQRYFNKIEEERQAAQAKEQAARAAKMAEAEAAKRAAEASGKPEKDEEMKDVPEEEKEEVDFAATEEGK